MARPENDQTEIRTVSLVGSKTYAVSIPIDIIRQLDISKGDKLLVRRFGETIIIEKEK